MKYLPYLIIAALLVFLLLGEDTETGTIDRENAHIETQKDSLKAINDSLQVAINEKQEVIDKLRDHIFIYENEVPEIKEVHKQSRDNFRLADDTTLVLLISGQRAPEGY